VGNLEIELLRPVGALVPGASPGVLLHEGVFQRLLESDGYVAVLDELRAKLDDDFRGFHVLGHRKVQAPQDVQYHGRVSSKTDWNCFFLTSILTLKGVLPDSGQLPVHFPHWMHVNTLVAACSTIICNPRW
jgi:hypothetical protein